jgi:ABC-type uncharacterized transport system permease subunit
MVETVVFGALCVLGLYAAMGEGMILEWLRDLFERLTNNRVLKYIRPALYECPICMASIWGTAVWLVIGNGFGAMWVLYVFAVAGFNYVTVNLISDDD